MGDPPSDPRFSQAQALGLVNEVFYNDLIAFINASFDLSEPSCCAKCAKKYQRKCKNIKNIKKTQKTSKNRKKRQKIAKNVKNAKNPYKPLFFVLFSKTRNFIRDLHGDFSPKTRFFSLFSLTPLFGVLDPPNPVFWGSGPPKLDFWGPAQRFIFFMHPIHIFIYKSIESFTNLDQLYHKPNKLISPKGPQTDPQI